MTALSKVAIAVGLLAWGCTSTKIATAVLVDIRARDAALDADTVRVRVLGGKDKSSLSERRVTDVKVEDGWPVTVAIEPQGGDARRAWRVEAWALARGKQLGAGAIEGGFASEKIVEESVVLTPSIDLGDVPALTVLALEDGGTTPATKDAASSAGPRQIVTKGDAGSAQRDGGGAAGEVPSSGSGGTGTSGSGSSGGGAGRSGSGGSSSGAGGMSGSGGSGGAGGSASDACPDDPGKTDPGTCGCGFPDVMDGCLGLRAALLHRYSFDGNGQVIKDSKGSDDGTVVNAQLDGSGALTLVGTSNQYATLPGNLLSPLTDATIEAWLTWRGGQSWQHAFVVGDCTTCSNGGTTYLYFVPKDGNGHMVVTFSASGTANQQTASAGNALSTVGMSHVVVVVDDSNDQLRLYIDGALQATTAFAGHLSQLNDVIFWLGRSFYSADPWLNAIFHEFRVYGAALTPGQITTSLAAGPDAGFL